MVEPEGSAAELEEAEQARTLYAEELRQLGAHAIAVDQVAGPRGTTYAVIAFVDREDVALPEYLELESGGQKKRVPVEARLQERFEPEGLA